MIEAPKESGLYVVEESSPIERFTRITLRRIDVDVPDVRVADINDNRIGSWHHFYITRYRKIDLEELLHGPQPSGVPDGPGWWRCKYRDSEWCFLKFWSSKTGTIFLMPNISPSIPPSVEEMARNGWQFAGRVEMPGEK